MPIDKLSIEQIRGTRLVGGNEEEYDLAPLTPEYAVYDDNDVRLDDKLKKIEADIEGSVKQEEGKSLIDSRIDKHLSIETVRVGSGRPGAAPLYVDEIVSDVAIEATIVRDANGNTLSEKANKTELDKYVKGNESGEYILPHATNTIGADPQGYEEATEYASFGENGVSIVSSDHDVKLHANNGIVDVETRNGMFLDGDRVATVDMIPTNYATKSEAQAAMTAAQNADAKVTELSSQVDGIDTRVTELEEGGNGGWKLVYDGIRGSSDSRTLDLGTYADGNPLNAHEILVQVVMTESASVEEQGYLRVAETNSFEDRTKAGYFGPIMTGHKSATEAIPYFSILHLYSGFGMITYCNYNNVSVKGAVAQNCNDLLNFGGVNNIGASHSKIGWIQFNNNHQLETNARFIILAR